MRNLKTLLLVAALVARPVAEAQNTHIDIMTGADLKLSTIVGKGFQYGLYGSAGVYARPISVDYIRHSTRRPEPIINKAPVMATSLSGGVEIGGKNKITGGISINNQPILEDKYTRAKFNLGYKRAVMFDRARINAYTGIFHESRSIGGNEDGAEYQRRGLELELEYEHALTKNLYLSGRAGFSQAFNRLSMGYDVDYDGNRRTKGPNSAISVNVGLHYKFRPELEMPNLDWNFDKKNKRVKTSKRKKARSDIPCYAYPKSSIPKGNILYNSPGGTNR